MFFSEPDSSKQSYRIELFLLFSVLLHLIIFLLLSTSLPSFQPKPKPKAKTKNQEVLSTGGLKNP